MNRIELKLAWRNLWRQPRRTWLTLGAMIFSNGLLAFMVSVQFGMYSLMIDNTLAILTGHLQVQAPFIAADDRFQPPSRSHGPSSAAPCGRRGAPVPRRTSP